MCMPISTMTGQVSAIRASEPDRRNTCRHAYPIHPYGESIFRCNIDLPSRPWYPLNDCQSQKLLHNISLQEPDARNVSPIRSGYLALCPVIGWPLTYVALSLSTVCYIALPWDVTFEKFGGQRAAEWFAGVVEREAWKHAACCHCNSTRQRIAGIANLF